MDQMINIFENEEFGSVRTLKEEAGRVVFCGKDVAAALGYSNTKGRCFPQDVPVKSVLLQLFSHLHSLNRTTENRVWRSSQTTRS